MEDVILENIWANWHIEKLIGSGSFGSVYKARRSGFGFEHDFYSAVKVIHVPSDDAEIRGLMADGMTMEQVQAYYDSALKNLVKEIELMETLKGSPNIVTIEDYEVRKNESGIGWTIYIRMELLKNLNQYRTEHPLTVEDIVHLGMDMCSALEYCAKKNIVHRDIKPDNIFVNEFGDFKLGDFGIARNLEMTAAHLSQKGTSAYMAPEIYRGDPYNGTVDIYSLGIVLYRLLNRGRLPFMPPYPNPISYEDTESAMTRRLAGEPMPEPAEGGKLLADIVRRACSADVNFRYHNPSDMKSDLFRWQVSGRHGQAASTETGTIPIIPDMPERSGSGSIPGMGMTGRGTVSGMNIPTADTTSDFNRNTGDNEHTAYMFTPNTASTERNIWGPGAQNPGGFRQGTPPGSSYGSAPGYQNHQGGYGQGQKALAAPGNQGQTGKKKSSKTLPIVLGCVLGAVALFAVIFFLVPVGDDTLFGKVMYSISDTDTRYNSAMEKGDEAYAQSDYEKALTYYRDKALKEKPKSMDAWLGVLKCHAFDSSVSMDAMEKNLLSDLEAIGKLRTDPDASQQQVIVDAVNSYMDARGETLVTELANDPALDVQAEIADFFDKYSQYTEAVAGKVDCGRSNASWYPVFYDILAATDGAEEYAKALLAEGYEKYPENEDIAQRQGVANEAMIAMGYDEINAALSSGDIEAAYELAKALEQTMDPTEYNNLVGSIDYINERTLFLAELQTMLNAGNYDGIANAIEADSAAGISTCYLVDGVYTSSVTEGTALLYDNNGLYYGQIENDRRKGSGFQLKYYSDGSYNLLDGTWDGNANGICTFTWWSADGTKAVVTGNFTDGYEDGTMTISWYQDGRDWTATYPADMGTYTEIRKEESGASIYAIAVASDESSAWWSTTWLQGNGCFIN